MKKIIILLCLVSLVNFAMAGELNTNFVDSIEEAAKISWGSKLYDATYRLFLILWGFETFYQCLTKHLFDFTKVRELARFLVVRIIFLTVFSSILIKPDFYLNIINYLIDPANHSNLLNLDPKKAWTSFDNYWNHTLPDQIKNATFGMSIAIGLAGVIYLIATLFLCFSIILIKVEIICIIYGALILTGCAGSSWTRSLWESYLSMAISMGIKCMMFLFLFKTLSLLISNLTVSTDYLSPLVNMVLVTLSMVIIPGKIAGAISLSGARDSLITFAAVATSAVKGGVTMGKNAGNITKGITNPIKQGANLVKGMKNSISSGGKSTQPIPNSLEKNDFMKSK